MKTVALCAALAFGGAAHTASAASLGLTTEPSPLITGTGTAVNRDFAAWTFYFEGTGGEVPAQVPPVSLGLTVFGDITVDQSAALIVLDGTTTPFLNGVLVDVGFTVDPLGNDTVELLYGNLTGSGTGAFGPQVLLILTGEFGADPVGGGFGTFATPVAVDFSLATVVPLPAGFPALGGALIVLAGVSRWAGRKAARSS